MGEAEQPLAEDLPEAAPEAIAASETEAAGEHFELLTAPRGAPDDLAKLQGVGPQIIKKLNDGGIFHYWQLAAMTPEDVAKVDHDLKLGGRIERDNWVATARASMAG